jgi:hypothetical protein
VFFVLGEVFEHFGNLDKSAELLVALNEQAKLHVLGIFRIVLPGHRRKKSSKILVKQFIFNN